MWNGCNLLELKVWGRIQAPTSKQLQGLRPRYLRIHKLGTRDLMLELYFINSYKCQINVYVWYSWYMWWDLQISWHYSLLFYWAATTECARKTKCRSNPFLGRFLTPSSLAMIFRLSWTQFWEKLAPVWSLLRWTVCTEEQRCPSIHWCSLVTHILRNISSSLVDNKAGEQ